MLCAVRLCVERSGEGGVWDICVGERWGAGLSGLAMLAVGGGGYGIVRRGRIILIGGRRDFSRQSAEWILEAYEMEALAARVVLC